MEPVPEPAAGTAGEIWDALRQPGLPRYFAGQALSISGTWMQTVAVAWVALELTGSPAAVGVVTAARTLPVLFLVIPAGVLSDRIERRRLIIGGSLIGLLASVALAALAAQDGLDLVALVALSAFAGVANAIEMPTFNSYLGQLAGRHILSAVALNGVVFNGARIIGPAIGGLLLASQQATLVFALNAVSYIAFIAILVTIRAGGRFVPPIRPGGARQALAYVLADRRLAILLGLLAVHTMTLSVPIHLAAPIADDLGGGAAGAGALVSAAGAGAILSLALIARTAAAGARGRSLVVAGVVGAGGQLALAAAGALTPGIVAMIACGAGMVAYTAISNAMIQTIGTEAYRGRLMSFYALVLPGTAPASALVAGLLAGAVGMDLTLVIAAGVWLAVLGAVALGSGAFRSLGMLPVATRPG